MRSDRMRVMVLTGLSAALIVVGTFIRIPLPVIPMTLQVPIILGISLLFGSRIATGAVALYVSLGLMGIPVFASGGGLGYVVAPSFGYLMGFVVGAALGGRYADYIRSERGRIRFRDGLIGGVLFLIAVYGVGLPYLWAILNWYAQTPTGWPAVVASGFGAVIGKDIVAVVVVAGVVQRIDVLIGLSPSESRAG